MTPIPGVAVTLPPHPVLALAGLATTKVPVVDGKVSLNPTPVRSPAAVVFGLAIVKVSVAIPFSGILTRGLNALLMVAGATTVMLAVLLVAPGPLSLEEIGSVVLFFTPAVVPVTSTVIVHWPLDANVPPASLMLW